MAKRLIVLMGAFADAGLLKGLGRNRMNVVWLPEGELGPRVRTGYSGVDWISVGFESKALPQSFQKETDRWLWLSEKTTQRPPWIDPEILWGVLPYPAVVRILVSVLKQGLISSQSFEEKCGTLHREWKQIQDAKELLMNRKAWSEPEAYNYMRRLSMNQCLTLEATAETIFREYGK